MFLKAASWKIFGSVDPGVLIALGVIFILLGLACLLFLPSAHRRAERYKKMQLERYRQTYHRPSAQYGQTGMYLPAWERVKLFSPIFFALVLIIIGVALLANL